MEIKINETTIILPKRVKKLVLDDENPNMYIFDKPFHFYLGKDGFDVPENSLYIKNDKIYFYKYKSFSMVDKDKNINKSIKNYLEKNNIPTDVDQAVIIFKLTYEYNKDNTIDLNTHETLKEPICKDIYQIATSVGDDLKIYKNKDRV